MGFFDKIKAAVGVGQPKMSVTVNNTQVQRGTAISGKCTLTAQDRQVPIEKFEIEFTQIRTTREWNAEKNDFENKKHFTTIAKKEVPMNGHILKAKESISEDFSIEASSDILSTGQSISYMLKVSADIPGLDASEKIEIFVV